MTARIQGAAGMDKPVLQSRAKESMVRVRRALWLVLGMLSLSLLLVVLGVYATTRTESLSVSGYTSGVILTLGSFLGLLGLLLEENRKQLPSPDPAQELFLAKKQKQYVSTDTSGAALQHIVDSSWPSTLTAAIVFLSFGIIFSFLCLVIDGACIVLNMDMRPLKAGRCQYYSSGSSYLYENFYTSVTCWNPTESCNITVRSGSCYCCDLYNCANGGYLSNYYEFVGVQSCEEVFTLYILIWTLTGLNLVAFFTGILTTAVLGSLKNLRSSSPVSEPSESTASSPTAPLLINANTHTVHQVHPVRGLDVFACSRWDSSVTDFSLIVGSMADSRPPPFAPLTSLPPYRVPGLSA